MTRRAGYRLNLIRRCFRGRDAVIARNKMPHRCSNILWSDDCAADVPLPVTGHIIT
jgi:hypothetical protein